MAEGSENLVSVSVGKDALKPKQVGRRRGMSRRAFVAGVAVLGTGALAVAATRGVITPKKVVEFLTPPEGKPTDEQVEAAKLLVEQKPEEFVYNIVAVGQKDAEGKIVPVKIRNKPAVPNPDDENPFRRGGKKLDELPLDQVIPHARVVWGSTPDPDDPAVDRWFTFEDPHKPGRMVFAYEGGFRIPDYKSYSKIQPVDIQNRLSKKSDKGLR